MKMMPRSLRHLAAASMAALSGCGSASKITDLAVPNQAELAQALVDAIQDEYHAEEVYQGVLTDFGEVAPFSNIIGAEERHSSAIARLFESRGWDVPASNWNAANVPHFESIAEACQTGVSAEIANVAVYDGLLADLMLPSDVVRVFESNRAASLERHLPAFERCAGI